MTRPAEAGALSFEITIAATRQGGYFQSGGLQKMIVVDPLQFAPPVRIGVFGGR
jgi:hypothetical protein